MKTASQQLRWISALLFLCLNISVAWSSKISVSGNISTNTTWSADTVEVTGEVIIDDEVTLTINPGVKVLFTGYHGILVNGQLLAEGGPGAGDTIYLESADSNGWYDFSNSTGGWKGINIDNDGSMDDNDTTRLSYCRIRFGKAVEELPGRKSGGGFSCEFFDKAVVENCLFENNYARGGGGAIQIKWAGGRITNCTLRNNHTEYGSSGYGGAIYFYGNDVSISGNLIENNYARQSGGAIYVARGSAIIRGNHMRDNTTGYGGGAMFIQSDEEVDVADNDIYRNSSPWFGGGIYVVKTATRITGNRIYENETTSAISTVSGGGVYFASGSVARLENNEIYSNVNSGSSGGGVRSDADSNFFIGNMIHGNSSKHGAGVSVNISSVYSLFQDNEVYGNTGKDELYTYGAGLLISGDQTDLIGNKVYNNSGVSHGAGVRISGSNVFIKNCLFANNEANEIGGGLFLDNTEGELINNIFANNESKKGGGIGLDASSPVFVNNTIAHNLATQAESGGALFIDDQSVPRFYNDIIYNNDDGLDTTQIFFAQTDPVAYFNNCNISGQFVVESGSLLGDYNEIISLNPDFTSPSSPAGNAGDGMAADWTLLASSPCINMGTSDITGSDLPAGDYFDNPRVSYSLPDIGIYEFRQSTLAAGGNINSDQTWTADTVKVGSKVHVLEGNTLTISPGVFVKFMGDHELEVSGSLKAIGTDSDSIIFSIYDTTEFSNPSVTEGGWSGLYFSVPNGVSEIAYARIEYVKEETYSNGAVYVAHGPSMKIRNSTFQHNMGPAGAGLKVDGTAVTLTDCRFTGNRTTGTNGSASAIYLSSSNSTIERCIFENNIASGKGTVYMTQSHPTIRDNVFLNNRVGHDGGALFIFAYSNPLVIGNTIHNNTAQEFGGGIYTFNKCSPTISLNHFSGNQADKGGAIYTDDIKGSTLISGNIIANNFAISDGGGLYIETSDPEISANTVVNNLAGSAGGGLFSSGSSPIILNTIFWGNEDGSGTNSLHILDGDGTGIGFSDVQGGEASITGGSAITYSDNLDEDPFFINPSGGTGSGFTTEAEGWQLYDVAGLINSGDGTLVAHHPSDLDLLGNARINGAELDIGALENQGGLPVIILQPGSMVRCTGDTAFFRVECTDSVNYQWQKDGMDIPGAVSAILEFSPVKVSDQAGYQCVLTNAYGSVQSSPVLLQVKEPPQILVGPKTTWAMPNSPVTLELYSRGSEPIFQWQKDGVDIPDANIPKLTLQDVNEGDESVYTCIISNSCGTDTTEDASLYMAPQLCMITVDDTSGNNLVIWEKTGSAPITAYNVYRESTAAGFYDLVATVPYDKLSVVEDSIANPMVQAYLYKITAIDTAGNESDLDLCRPHKTIHLLVSTNPELDAPQLEWDRYYGFLYSSYDIYRSTDGEIFNKVHTISSSFYSWTDLNPSEGINYYRIGVDKGELCIPTGTLKAGTGPYQHALSNLDDNKLKEGEDNQAPDSIILSNNTIDENLTVGSVVGRLSSRDADTADYHIYKLVSGDGDADNSKFTTLGDLLVSADVFDFEVQDTLYVRIKTVDKGDLSFEMEFLVLVNDVGDVTGNTAPTGITLSNNSVDENLPVGTLIGRLSSTDADTAEHHTYSIVSGQGDTDNNRFTVLGDMLLTAESFDFETRDSLYVRIRSTDKGDLSFDQDFLVLVSDVASEIGSHAPTDILLSKDSIFENQSVGTLIGRFSAVDEDSADYHTYQLTGGEGSEDNGRFAIMGDLLISAEKFDFETDDSLNIRVRVMDKDDHSTEKAFVIRIIDVSESAGNLAPTEISLNTASIEENQPVGTLVGRLATTDPNQNDDHRYRLVDGLGADDNASFALIGDMLVSAAVFDYEQKDSFTIRVRSTDDGDGDLAFEKTFTISVIDLLESTGIGVPAQNGILIFPNPVQDYAIIRFHNPGYSEYKLKIRDSNGRTVRLVGNITEGEFLLKRGRLSKGLYLLELSGEKTYRTMFVIE